MVAPARLALVFNAEGGDVLQGTYQAFEFVTDIATGAVLHQESLIHDVDVSGTISGMATTGFGADICGGIAAVPLPYAKATIGGTSVFADPKGNFTIPNAGATDVTVEARLQGQFFNVINTVSPGGGTTVLSQVVTPPGPADFMFNAANDNQFKRAEVNAYLEANRVRDYVLFYNPAYPVIAGETNFTTNVNINQTCNAFYSSANQSINFYIAGGACSNTSNSTVVHHEYGHRLVNAAGSGQGAYGEGTHGRRSPW
jgi:hypothetical protein